MAQKFDSQQPLETIFPYASQKERLNRYAVNSNLLKGNHWESFALQGDKQFSERYAKLRYVICNFAGLISKVIADSLFGEGIEIKANKNQQWLEKLYFKSGMQQQNYESAMSNSARGDAVYRIRVENKEIKVEDMSPVMYFPHIDKANPRRDPDVEELAWIDTVGATKYLVREMHEIGKVSTFINELDAKGNLDVPVDVKTFNAMAGTSYVAFVDTKIKHKLLVHIPNFRFSGEYWGVSDYTDINSLQFELNNRMTKIGNILDKHTDPILAVPEGVLDEEGRVKKEFLTMVEIASKDSVKPEYITWDASLDNAFKEIDKLVEFLFMCSETSPDVMGMGKGTAAESGRALKMRMIRTLAKKNRKQLYYDQGLRQVFLICQELSRANGFTVDGEKCPFEPELPFLKWSDGVINDTTEMNDEAIKKLDAGLISKKSAIMEVEGVSEQDAKKIMKELEKENSAKEPLIPANTNAGENNNNKENKNTGQDKTKLV
jgi:hypothetical protein